MFIAALLGCCAVLTLSSCSKKASAAIIGKWRVQGESAIIEFRKDGTLTISHNTGPATGQTEDGTYTFTDSSHMKMELKTGDSGKKAPQIANWTVQIHGDAMDMSVVIKRYESHLNRIK